MNDIELLKNLMNSLVSRVRPNVEAAPWVVDELNYIKSTIDGIRDEQANLGSVKSQAQGWVAIVEELNKVTPGWLERNGTGIECALYAIRTLAKKKVEIQTAEKVNLTAVEQVKMYKDLLKLVAADDLGGVALCRIAAIEAKHGEKLVDEAIKRMALSALRGDIND